MESKYHKTNKKLTEYSKQLRKDMTPEEKHLWYDFLKSLNITVHKQYVIGQYIADFYIAEKKIVIELDGREHKLEENRLHDAERDKYMNEKGITVLRYKNKYIHDNFNDVCNEIRSYLDK